MYLRSLLNILKPFKSLLSYNDGFLTWFKLITLVTVEGRMMDDLDNLVRNNVLLYWLDYLQAHSLSPIN